MSREDEGQPVEGLGVWEHFTVRDGLPDMKIECIFEDSRRVLWIGTHDRGVVRYEGDGFQAFTHRDGLAGNGVFSVLEDRQGHLWFGTNHGLTRYDGTAFEVLDAGEPCSCLWGRCVDQEGRLWFGLERRPGRPPAVVRWDGARLEIVGLSEKAQEHGQSIHQVVVDTRGGVWCGGHGLYYHDRSGIRCLEGHPGSLDQINCIVAGRDQCVLLASDNGVYSRVRGSFLRNTAIDGWVAGASTDGRGTTWLATHDGRLLRVGGDRVTLVGRRSTSFWRGLCVDHIGRVWLSTYGMGLYCYDATRVRIYRSAQGLPADQVHCLAEDGEGTLWVGTRQGLAVHDGQRPSIPQLGTKMLERTGITGLLADRQGRMWIGTRTGFLCTFKQGEFEMKASPREMVGYRVSSLSQDDQGRVWFGSRHGKALGYCDGDRVHLLDLQEGADYPTWVGAIAVDSEGVLWLGSASPTAWDGLCRYDGSTYSRVPGVSGTPILALCAVRRGCLWVGTTEGLARYDGFRMASFGADDGLSCEIVTAITQTDDGVLWIGTEGGGVCCYDGKVCQVLQFTGQPECSVVHAILQDRKGRLWFATEGGLVQYVRQRVAPSVVVEQLVADQVYERPTDVQVPTTAGRIRFCFRGRSTVEDAAYLVYRYRLHGHDRDWRQTRERQAEYPQLRQGEYQFAVQAVDRDLNYSEEARVALKVTEDVRIEGYAGVLSTGASVGQFIGHSAALKGVMEKIDKVARSNATVLIVGETGTGKGLAARAIHGRSERSRRPFIQVNCGALPETLADSELFGHERGAFTGAVSRKLGKFELAEGGTIFLDEVGDLALGSQTRLLHVLQEHYIERIGGTQPISVDVRVVAATNRDLARKINEGSFRADLYYRLEVFPLEIPPLRQRREDVPLLAESFVRRHADHLGRETPKISDEAMCAMLEYQWPGNVRELEHMLQRAVLLAGDGDIKLEHVLPGPTPPRALDESHGFAIVPWEVHERLYLAEVLERTGWVVDGKKGAAVLLKMKSSTLRSRMAKLGLRRARPGPGGEG
jgi:DNA-binding NtrC family response regulator/ligand-binding sensor domain-containing protein